MPSINRKRIEWSVRMGVIYFLTILYAVKSEIRNSSVLGTWPILANFYATFTLGPSVGFSVLYVLEMARGCVVGYSLSWLATELALVSIDEEVGATWVLAIVLFLMMAFITAAPIFTFDEKKMALFSLVSSGYNGHARLRNRYDDAFTLDARYDVWYHPFLELLSSLMGMAIALLVVFLPYGMWAVTELRARMEYQARAISALLRTQHGAAMTNSTTAISQSRQIRDTLRSNAEQMAGLLPYASYEVIRSGAAIKQLRDTVEHLDRQLPLLLSKGLTVDSRLDDGNARGQDDQMRFLSIMDASWEALEHAVDDCNFEMLSSEREQRPARADIWSQLEYRLNVFSETVAVARKEVFYGGSGDASDSFNKKKAQEIELSEEVIERHTRRMAHLFYVEQHALRVKNSLAHGHSQPPLDWTCRRVLHFLWDTIFGLAVGSRGTWKAACSKSELVASSKIVAAVLVAMLFHFVPAIRNSHFISGQGTSMLITVIFVLCKDTGSSVRIGEA